MRKISCRIVIVLVVIALVPLSCNQQSQDILRIGTNVWPGYEPLYLARELKYFKDVPIQLVEFTSATEVLRAYRNGVIELAALTLDEVLLLSQNGFNPKVILVMDISHGGDVILGKPEIKSLIELKGCRVGVESTALGAYVLSRAMQLGGLSFNDLKIIPLEVDEHERAFIQDRVDAIVTFEPTRSKLLKNGAVQLFDSTQISGEIVDVLIASKETVKMHKETIKALIQNWFYALNYLDKKPENSAHHMIKRLKMSTSQFQDSLAGLKLPTLDENRSLLTGETPALLKSAQKLKTIMLKENLLKNDVDITQIVNGQFVKTLKLKSLTN